MLYIALIKLIAVFIAIIIIGCFKPKSIYYTVPTAGALFIISLIINYFTLGSRTFLSLVSNNLVMLIIFSAIIFPPVMVLDRSKVKKISSLVVTMAVILLIISGIGAAHTYLSKKPLYDSLKTEVKEEAPRLSKNENPITISPKTVRNKMNKAMSIVGNSSFYRLGDLQTQTYQGKAVYIAPIEFDGFWPWFKKHETPGYFMVSATNMNSDPVFVKKKMKYTPSSYLSKDAERIIYNKFPNWCRTGDAQLEVDDNGTPYYIQTMYKTRGLSNRINYNSLHVAVLNAQNKNIRLYKAADAPSFIDESIDSSTAKEMNDVYGHNVHGLWNFSGLDKMNPTNSGTEDGVTPVFDKKGRTHYFTDFTSVHNNSDSTTGYSMIDARTGKLTFYKGKNIGVMDSKGAIELANKEYVAQNWTGTMPIMYNIDGTPTWVISILDSTGSFRNFAYIKAADQNVKVYAPTAKQALDLYRVQLENADSNPEDSDAAKTKKVNGTIDRFVVINKNNFNNVMFTLKNDKTLYTVSTENYPKAVLMHENDQVKLTAKYNSAGNTATVDSMKDKTLD